MFSLNSLLCLCILPRRTKPSTPLPQVEPTPRVPVEVCEHVIEAVYEDNYYMLPTALATLSRCALVCRAWRSPAQKVLFNFVVIRDKDALYRFAELLDTSPELGAYVRRLELRGYQHVPFSPAVLFPAALGARLTNLTELFIHELVKAEKATKPLPDGVKELPSLPIHRYLPCLFTCVSHVRILYLADIAFTSFGDYARILDAFSNLRELYCEAVSWVVFGREPLCMEKSHSGGSQQTFLPNLKVLQCTNMDVRGRQRLLDALGPSLQTLIFNFPNPPQSEPSSVQEKDPSSALDLSSLSRLDLLIAKTAHFMQTVCDSTLGLQTPYGHGKGLQRVLEPSQSPAMDCEPQSMTLRIAEHCSSL